MVRLIKKNRKKYIVAVLLCNILTINITRDLWATTNIITNRNVLSSVTIAVTNFWHKINCCCCNACCGTYDDESDLSNDYQNSTDYSINEGTQESVLSVNPMPIVTSENIILPEQNEENEDEIKNLSGNEEENSNQSNFFARIHNNNNQVSHFEYDDTYPGLYVGSYMDDNLPSVLQTIIEEVDDENPEITEMINQNLTSPTMVDKGKNDNPNEIKNPSQTDRKVNFRLPPNVTDLFINETIDITNNQRLDQTNLFTELSETYSLVLGIISKIESINQDVRSFNSQRFETLRGHSNSALEIIHTISGRSNHFIIDRNRYIELCGIANSNNNQEPDQINLITELERNYSLISNILSEIRSITEESELNLGAYFMEQLNILSTNNRLDLGTDIPTIKKSKSFSSYKHLIERNDYLKLSKKTEEEDEEE